MKTKILLEFGCNHQGNKEIVYKMIDEAARLGVWGIKFQKRDLKSLPENVKHIARDMKNSFGRTYYAHRKVLEFSIEELVEFKEYARKKGLITAISVFDMESAKQTVEAGFNYIKLPSQLLLRRDLVDYISSQEHATLIGSTGMHTIDEVMECDHLYKFDFLFFCRSVYPCSLQEVKLKEFKRLQHHCDYAALFGYSSHDKDGIAIKYAVLLGARIIERHFTLNKTWKGSDHSTVSSTPEEIETIQREIDFIETFVNASGPMCDKEKKIRKIYRGF